MYKYRLLHIPTAEILFFKDKKQVNAFLSVVGTEEIRYNSARFAVWKQTKIDALEMSKDEFEFLGAGNYVYK